MASCLSQQVSVPISVSADVESLLLEPCTTQAARTRERTELERTSSATECSLYQAGSLEPKLTARRLLLSQVLTNCIGNAVKHHDKEAGRIEVSARDEGSFYRFEVADDGSGIPESERERVFEMFQTLAKDDSTHSTGIGLALVKKIIAGEGGELWVEPHTPRGCKFCFTWPKDSAAKSISE